MTDLTECRMIGHQWPHGNEVAPVGRYVCERCSTVLTIHEDGSRTYEYPNGEAATPTDTRDYMTSVDEHGADLDHEIPMTCNDCGRPAYYDRGDEDYHHAKDARTGCFLIRSERREDDDCHPLIACRRIGHQWLRGGITDASPLTPTVPGNYTCKWCTTDLEVRADGTHFFKYPRGLVSE